MGPPGIRHVHLGNGNIVEEDAHWAAAEPLHARGQALRAFRGRHQCGLMACRPSRERPRVQRRTMETPGQASRRHQEQGGGSMPPRLGLPSSINNRLTDGPRRYRTARYHADSACFVIAGSQRPHQVRHSISVMSSSVSGTESSTPSTHHLQREPGYRCASTHPAFNLHRVC